MLTDQAAFCEGRCTRLEPYEAEVSRTVLRGGPGGNAWVLPDEGRAMSEMYEGVVFRSDERTARRTFGSLTTELRLRLVRLARGAYGIYRVAGRADPFDRPAVERVAERVSLQARQTVALFYENRCAIRAGVLYSSGCRVREFGDGDAWWVPCREEGELVRNGRRFRITELLPGVDYECVFSATDAALEALGVGARVSARRVMQAFCYEKLESLAETGSPS
jgi:hypothetical protein